MKELAVAGYWAVDAYGGRVDGYWAVDGYSIGAWWWPVMGLRGRL